MQHDVQIRWGTIGSADKSALRLLLRSSLKNAGLLPCWREKTAQAGYGTSFGFATATTIVVNGHLVYKSSRTEHPVTEAELTDRILNYSSLKRERTWWRIVRSVSVAVFIALFPKCPVCWATYMSIFGFMGVGRIPYAPWLIYLLLAVAAYNVYHSVKRARAGGMYLVSIIQVVAYVLLLINWKYFSSPVLALCCIGGLLTASLINNLKKKFFSIAYRRAKLA